MRRLGLRARVALALGLVCSLAVVTLGTVLYSASERMEEALVDQIVGEELDALVARAGEGRSAPSSGPNFQYYSVPANDDSRLPAPLRGLGSGMHELGEGAEELHVGVRVVDGVRHVVAYDAGPHEERESGFKSLVLLALAVVTVVSLAFGYWLAGVLTRQITELAHRVGRLQPASEPAGLARPDQDPEVAALAGALDEYQVRISRMIAREQEFATDASHELRTPLTAIGTSCELLLEEPGLSERGRERLRTIGTAAAQMSEQVQTLLLLAREQSPAQLDEVQLRGCVETAAAALAPDVAAKGLALQLDVPEDARVRANPQVLHAVVANLLRNAVQYTDAGHVRVSYRRGTLSVADTGAGIAPEHLERVFDRFYRQGARGEGLGVGLAIVKRLCDHHGWRVEAHSTPGSGSLFTVDFQPGRA